MMTFPTAHDAFLAAADVIQDYCDKAGVTWTLGIKLPPEVKAELAAIKKATPFTDPHAFHQALVDPRGWNPQRWGLCSS